MATRMATLFLSLILTVCFMLRVTDGQALGFILNGVTYPNGSTVLRTDIGEGDAALQCTTDRVDCCRSSDGTAAGDFYFPNGTQVPILGNDPSIRTYYRNRGFGFIRLNRRSVATETGQFHCQIPDASGTSVHLLINIVNFLSITTSGTNTAGETYSLECSVTVIGSTDQPTITWLNPMKNTVPSEMVTTTGRMSTLTFNPLAASHAGTYTCRGMVGDATQSITAEIIVQNPTITVTMTAGIATPVVGSMYSLTCTVTGAERLTDSTMNYHWFKNGEVVSGQTMETLSFTSLSFSDAGGYTCQATVMSSLLSGPITMSSTNTVEVRLTFPNPSVSVTSDQPNPIRPIGSTVTLTCTVVLAEYVEGLTVNTEWTEPNGFSENGMAQRMGSTTTYTSTAMVSSFRRDQSGNYTCTATVSSTSSFVINSMGSSSTRVTVGVYLSLKGVVYPNNSVILITEIEQTNTTSNNGLQCITDRRPCCRGAGIGEWFFPDGGMVAQLSDSQTTYYRNRGDDGTVDLNRLNNDAMIPTGRFCCVVPDATGVSQWRCAVISIAISLSITTSGTNTAGETYSLECSTTVTGSTDQPTITWLDPMNNTVPSEMVTTTGSMSSLTFNPLAVSHAGTYTCRVTAEGVTETQTSTVIVNVITAQVTHSSSGPLTAGQTGFSLSCDVTGTENLNTPTFTYVWRRNGGAISIQHRSTLSLSPLTASNAGEYNCSVTVSSTSLSSTVTVNSINTDTLSLLLLQHNVSLTSNSSNPILFGSDITLTCTVELSPGVDIPVTVNTVWTGPSTNSFAPSPTLQEALTLHVYRSELVLKSVESANSGQYTCSTEVVSGVKELASTNIEIVDGLFQLRLKAVDICTQWHITRSSKEAIKYVNYIDLALVEVIERHCKCRFPVDNLLEGSFSCEESPDLMTYRSAVVGTHNFNGSRIVGFIQDWVSSGPRIKIDRSHVRVDSSCPVALTSLDEPECGLKEVCLTSGDDPHSFTVCANKLDNRNVATCFQDCIANN